MFTEDLRLFFATSGFGVVGVLNGAVSVNGILDRAFAEVLDVQGNAPVFTCPEASVPGVKHGDTLLIGATTFKVRGVQPDGTGVVALVLEEQ